MARKRKSSENIKKPLLAHLTEAFDMPKETVMDIPLITLTGNTEVYIENFMGIIEYTEEIIRLNTKSGILAVAGKKLQAKSMNVEAIRIEGYIHSVAFSR